MPPTIATVVTNRFTLTTILLSRPFALTTKEKIQTKRVSHSYAETYLNETLNVVPKI